MKTKQKQALIDMMKGDEELGLYEQPIAEDAKAETVPIEDLGFTPHNSNHPTYIKAYKQAMKDFRICKKCGKQVRSEEEYKLFLGCSGCASTLD